ncbi:MAG: MoxR family ATPase [Desulfosalsimonas sp.]|uniref:AAA family ATPase n=1 Tax=Desulfosalsimonas sp. TaxID=3073848 RepID=UPI003970990A
MEFESIEDVTCRLERAGYIPSREIATVVFLAAATQKPILVEGPAGGGKTELARAVARCLGRDKIRLQCYEGLDEAKALYEWEYAKQLLYTQMIKEKINDLIAGADSIAEAVERIAEQEDAFFPSASSLPGPFGRPFLRISPWCCSSMKSTRPIRNLRRFCWSCSRNSRSPSRSWASARPGTSPWWCSPPTTTGT